MSQADLTLNDGGTHNIDSAYPGNPISGNLLVYDGSDSATTTVNLLTGGSVGGHLYARNSSLVNIDGGSIGGTLVAEYSSVVNIYDGSIGGGNLILFDSSTVNIYGGSMLDRLETLSDELSPVSANIYGAGFNYPYGPITDYVGTITGMLHMGDSLSMDFTQNYFTGVINLHEMAVIPAPGAALLGILGLISASWRLRKRRTV